MKRLILVDGNSLMYRAYFGMADVGSLTQNSKGLYTNAIYAFARMINTLCSQPYDNMLVAFDAGKKTFRHEMVSDYKAGRSAMPDEMRMQIAYIKEFLEIKKIKQYQLELYEADDIIGTIAKEAKEAGYHVDVYSSDKDLLQLIDENVCVHMTKKGMSVLEDYDASFFYNKYQISHKQFVDLKALMGDKSDNLSGIPGIGEKKAVKYLQAYGNLEGIIEHMDEIKGSDGVKIKEHYETALLCKKMVTINCDSPLTISLEDTQKQEYDVEKLLEFYQYMEFNSLIKELSHLHKHNKEELIYQVIDEAVDLKSILLPYSSIIFETFEYNYHKAPLLLMGIKNSKGSFVIKPELLSQSIDLQLFLSDTSNHKNVFDYKRAIVLLKNLGFELNGVDFDMLLATYILNPTIAKDEFQAIASFYAYHDVSYEEEIYGKGAKRTIPKDEILFAHVVKKANCAYILRRSIMEKLGEKQQTSLLLDIEIPLSRVLAKMEFTGMKIDLEELKRQKENLKNRIAVIESEIYRLSQEEFNIASPKQLGVVLFEHLGLKCPKKTKTGYSTDIEVLESLKKEHPIIEYIIAYRQLTKLNSTYVEGMEAQIFPDGKVHTIFQQALTQTGRLSSVEPNLQNIPIRTIEGHQIRKLFIPENAKNRFFAADYSQIELRVLAHMGQIKKMIDSFNAGEDIHAKTAKEIFNKSEITKEDRYRAKAVNFGIVYGISAFGLASDINISNIEAAQFIKKYFEVYPEIKEFMDGNIEFAKENMYVKTIKNRIRYIPDINSKIYQVREFAKRTAMNAPVQGSAADIIKIAMIKIDEEFEKRKLRSKMLVQVHDELVFEVVKEEENVIEALVKNIMEQAVELDVKLEVDYSFGNNWYEVK